MASALATDPRAMTTAATRPSTIREKYSAALKLTASAVEREYQRGDHQRGDAAGEQRAERRHRQRRAGAALPRHLVSVDAGHDRGALARQIDQDGRGRAAVLGAVIDRRQHDQRGDRLQIEGDRQQHRQRRERADAGQDADQRPDQRADQRETDIDRLQRGGEPERQMREQVHVRTPAIRGIGKPSPQMKIVTVTSARTAAVAAISSRRTRGLA